MSEINQDLDAKSQLNIKVYSRWASYQLKHTEYVISDISKDLQDGILLLQLAKVLTKDPFPQNLLNKSLGKQNAVSKLDHAISMFYKKGVIFGVKQNTVCGEDIYNGNIKQILFFFWILIKNYSIDKAVHEDRLFKFDKKDMDEAEIEKKNSIQLLKWATNKIQSYPNIEKNFKPYDLAICALLHSYLPKFKCPDEFDYNSLDINNHDKNIQIAVDFMEKQRIPAYIFADDINKNDYQVDDSSLMTQLSAIKIFLDRNFPYRDSVIGRNQNLYKLQIQQELKEKESPSSILAQENQNNTTDQIPSEKPEIENIKETDEEISKLVAKEVEKREKIWKEKEQKERERLLNEQKEMLLKEIEEREKSWKEREERERKRLLNEQRDMFLKLLKEKIPGQNFTFDGKSSHKKFKLVIRSKFDKNSSDELSLTDNKEDLSISPLNNSKGKRLKVRVKTDDDCLEKTYDEPTSGLKIVFHEGNSNKD